MNRRHVLPTLAAGGLAAVAGACRTDAKADAPADASGVIDSSRRYEWIMVSTWPPGFPLLQDACTRLADDVRAMSGGQLNIKVYAAGELIPAFECFEAVSLGTAAIASGASYYWAGKLPAAQFFSSVPFGLNAQGMNAWLLQAGGLELWREAYAPFNLRPYPGGNTGVQMAGWFKRELTDLRSFSGLKMRIPGLGGKVFEAAGGTSLLIPGTELYTNLERGVLDAAEWIGPYHDYLMGFHEVADYYYGPGWHEPGTVLEIIVHEPTYASLPAHLRAILDAAIARVNAWTLESFEAFNGSYVGKLREVGTEIRVLPQGLLDELRPIARQVVADLAASDPFARRVHDHYEAFADTYRPWSDLGEGAYWRSLARAR